MGSRGLDQERAAHPRMPAMSKRKGRASLRGRAAPESARRSWKMSRRREYPKLPLTCKRHRAQTRDRKCPTAHLPSASQVSRGGGLSSLAPISRAIFTDLVSAETQAPGRYLILQQQPTSWSIRCSLRTNAEEGQLSLRLRASQNRAPRERLRHLVSKAQPFLRRSSYDPH